MTAEDVRTNEKLKKAKLEHGFDNIIDGERVFGGKTLSVVNPATGKQLAIVPDVDHTLLDKAVRFWSMRTVTLCSGLHF